MNKLRPTLSGVLLSKHEQMLKLYEEVNELAIGVLNNDKVNIEEEIMDVFQCCINIAEKNKLNLEFCVYKHNKKLKKRGHIFIEEE